MVIERVDDFVSKEILKSEDKNVAVYGGTMWRYMPGFVKHFHPKYCLLTKSAFFYFENKQKALNKNPKPLAMILLSDIESAQRVKVSIPEEKQIINQQKKKTLFDYTPTCILPQYQFEIFLKKSPEEDKLSPNSLNTSEYLNRQVVFLV